MFEAKSMLFIYVETPLHAGTGRGLGAVDLPIQRERTTGYPIVQASSLKGRLRAASDPDRNPQAGLTKAEHLAIFGPETDNASDYAGALSTGDARILLFPVRLLAGVFAWTTSIYALQRFARDCALAGMTPPNLNDLSAPAEGNALVGEDTSLKAGGMVVLEEFSYSPQSHAKVAELGRWIAEQALPDSYTYWKHELPKKLVILPDNDFRDFVLYGTEVQTHIKLDPDKKTVQSGALWTTESLPVDTLLYAPLMATKSRASGVDLSGQQVLEKVKGLGLVYTQLGGDETTGQGMVAFRFSNGGEQ